MANRSQAMTCAQCDAGYDRGRRGPAGRYCSNGCRVEAWRARFPAKARDLVMQQAEKNREAKLNRRRKRVFTCLVCQCTFGTLSVRGGFPKQCSETCKERARDERWREEHGVSRQAAWNQNLTGEEPARTNGYHKNGYYRSEA